MSAVFAHALRIRFKTTWGVLPMLLRTSSCRWLQIRRQRQGLLPVPEFGRAFPSSRRLEVRSKTSEGMRPSAYDSDLQKLSSEHLLPEGAELRDLLIPRGTFFRVGSRQLESICLPMSHFGYLLSDLSSADFVHVGGEFESRYIRS